MVGAVTSGKQILSADWKYGYLGRKVDEGVASNAAMKTDVKPVFGMPADASNRAMSASGSNMAEFKVNCEKGGYKSTFDLFVNGTLVGNGFKPMPLVMRFTDENNLQFLAEKGTDLVRGTYRLK